MSLQAHVQQACVQACVSTTSLQAHVYRRASLLRLYRRVRLYHVSTGACTGVYVSTGVCVSTVLISIQARLLAEATVVMEP